jgi:exopolysaccharide biosynthesis polyprenyl glycosylphosphotransferase
MVASSFLPANEVRERLVVRPNSRIGDWETFYSRTTFVVDLICGLAAGLLAFAIRFGGYTSGGVGTYLGLSFLLPTLWVICVRLAGGYDQRFIGVGSDEFRRVLNAGVFLTAGVAVTSYAAKVGLARGYVVIALPSLTLFDLTARYALRKRLHRLRRTGRFMARVVAVGYASTVAELATVLRRENYHGLCIVAACIADSPNDAALSELLVRPASAILADIVLMSGIDDIIGMVERNGANTVAVLPCPEMSGVRLRDLAWQLEKTGTDLCVAPALLDVAGPRTTIRPVAGLPLLHMDHPEFTGLRRVIKSGFDRFIAAIALLLASPLLLAIVTTIRLSDGGPALFRQQRVGKDGQSFTLFKFRTMVMDAEHRKDLVSQLNETDGLLFKIRRDPRVTPVGQRLRRWSLDELPQLINVLIGNMSLVGPRPALPEEAALYGDHVRRRLAVKPGITGLWQVKGRSDLSWDESIRLDLRYVENWSFVLDLQILWKTGSAVARGTGAY